MVLFLCSEINTLDHYSVIIVRSESLISGIYCSMIFQRRCFAFCYQVVVVFLIRYCQNFDFAILKMISNNKAIGSLNLGKSRTDHV